MGADIRRTGRVSTLVWIPPGPMPAMGAGLDAMRHPGLSGSYLLQRYESVMLQRQFQSCSLRASGSGGTSPERLAPTILDLLLVLPLLSIAEGSTERVLSQ